MLAFWLWILAAPPPLAVRADGPDRFVVQAGELDLTAWAKACRIVPAMEGGEAVGFKLFGIRPASPVAALGFQNGDVVRRVGGRSLTSASAALEVYAWARTARTIPVEIERQGARRTVTYVLEGPDRLEAPLPPEPEAPPGAPAPRGAPDDRPAAGWPAVRPDGPNRFRVDALRLETPAWDRVCRMVPAFEAGRPIGIKLYGIRPGSLLAALGLQNGDVLRRVGDRVVTGPDMALEAVTWGRDARTIPVDLDRRGARVTLTYVVDGPGRIEKPLPPPLADPPVSRGAAAPEPTGPFQPTAVAPGHFRLTQADLDTLASGRAARVIPRTTDGGLVLVLAGIRAGGPAAVLGFQNADRITHLDGQPLTTPEAVAARWQALREAGGTLRLDIDRRGTPVVLQFTVDPPSAAPVP